MGKMQGGKAVLLVVGSLALFIVGFHKQHDFGMVISRRLMSASDMGETSAKPIHVEVPGMDETIIITDAVTPRPRRLSTPKGPGQQEETQAIACEECQKHAPYLDTKDPCVCHATELSEGWMWNCRPLGDGSTWNQC